MSSPATAPTPAVEPDRQEPFIFAVALQRDGEKVSAQIDVVVDSPDQEVDAEFIDDLAPAFWVIGKKTLETYNLVGRHLPPATITAVRPVLEIAANAKDVGFTVVVTETPDEENPARMELDSTTELHDEASLLLAASVMQTATGYLYESLRCGKCQGG